MFIFPALQANPPAHHRTISVPKASPSYSLSVDIDTTAADSDDPIAGSAVVKIVSRPTGKTIQSLKLPSLTLFKGKYALSVAPKGLSPSPYGDTYSFVFEDFDFDGIQDLAICKDLSGSYGGPTYDVYRWTPSRKQFVKDAMLSKLSSESLGLVAVDPKKHEIISFVKSGAAWHKSSFYAWRKKRLTLVKDETDDATGAKEVLTTRTLVGSHWRVTVRKQAIKS